MRPPVSVRATHGFQASGNVKWVLERLFEHVVVALIASRRWNGCCVQAEAPLPITNQHPYEI